MIAFIPRLLTQSIESRRRPSNGLCVFDIHNYEL
jgi:hypothetical protein